MKIHGDKLLTQVQKVKTMHRDFLGNILKEIGVKRTYFYWCCAQNKIGPKTAKKLQLIGFDMDSVIIKDNMSKK